MPHCFMPVFVSILLLCVVAPLLKTLINSQMQKESSNYYFENAQLVNEFELLKIYDRNNFMVDLQYHANEQYMTRFTFKIEKNQASFL